MLENSKKYILKISFLYTNLVFIFLAIPMYFYIQLEKKQLDNQINLNMYNYIQNLSDKIYEQNFDSFSNLDIFKSFKYDITIYDMNSKIIYKTKKDYSSDQYIIMQDLAPNIYGFSKIRVEKQKNYNQIYLKVLIIVMIIMFFIFISIYLIIKASIEPYKKMNLFLDKFFNDCLHELKTPLGVIGLNVEILNEKIPEVKEIHRCINGVKNLQILYDDMEYNLKNKRVQYTKEDINLSVFLYQRAIEFETLLKPKNLTYDFDIDKDLFININRIKLCRIIDNTLSNTYKYSHKNTHIIIKVKKINTNIIYSITNFGEIIIDSKKIFDRYYRQNSVQGGLGLGLNIVKNICDEENIDIKVVSNQKEGTTFTFIFK